jgi:hypothetical protein
MTPDKISRKLQKRILRMKVTFLFNQKDMKFYQKFVELQMFSVGWQEILAGNSKLLLL